MNTEIQRNRENINKWFGSRFSKERQLQSYKNVIQGSYVPVDFSSMRTRKYDGVDELLVIA